MKYIKDWRIWLVGVAIVFIINVTDCWYDVDAAEGTVQYVRTEVKKVEGCSGYEIGYSGSGVYNGECKTFENYFGITKTGEYHLLQRVEIKPDEVTDTKPKKLEELLSPQCQKIIFQILSEGGS